jgi:catechol 2,3-dioxygenase-like lactoylglutathione lyase family enzyme
MPAPLIEFPADDPERARRFWRGVLDAELAHFLPAVLHCG